MWWFLFILLRLHASSTNCDYFSFNYIGECQSVDPFEIFFLIDSSSRLTTLEYQHVKLWLESLLHSPPPSNIEFGLIQFATDATVEFGLGDYFDIADAINRIQTMSQLGHDGSCPGCGIIFANAVFSPTVSDENKIIFVITKSIAEDIETICRDTSKRLILVTIGENKDDIYYDFSCLIGTDGWDDVYSVETTEVLDTLRWSRLEDFVCERPLFEGDYFKSDQFYNSKPVYNTIGEGDNTFYYDDWYNRWSIVWSTDTSKMFATLNGGHDDLVSEFSSWGDLNINRNIISGSYQMQRVCSRSPFPSTLPTSVSTSRPTLFPTRKTTTAVPSQFPLSTPSRSPTVGPTTAPVCVDDDDTADFALLLFRTSGGCPKLVELADCSNSDLILGLGYDTVGDMCPWECYLCGASMSPSSSRPSSSPSLSTFIPTNEPSFIPTNFPSFSPSHDPSGSTDSPSLSPSPPSRDPSKAPVTPEPSNPPSLSPTRGPTLSPTPSRTTLPGTLTEVPSQMPNSTPSRQPTVEFPVDHITDNTEMPISREPTVAQPSVDCEAHHGSEVGDDACCGQGGTVSSDEYICPEHKPVCRGYIQGHKYGTCSDGTPTAVPSQMPKSTPSRQPTVESPDFPTDPIIIESNTPISTPSRETTVAQPSGTPTIVPTQMPKSTPSRQPTVDPTVEPTARVPSPSPVVNPTDSPTTPKPSTSPTTPQPTVYYNESLPWFTYCPNLVVTHGGNCEESTMDWVFLLDTSNQMSSSDYLELQQYMIDFTDEVLIQKGPRMGVVQYSNFVQLEYNIGDHPYTEWAKELVEIHFEGGATSDLRTAIEFSLTDMWPRSEVEEYRSEREKILVIITGDDENNACDLKDELDALNIEVHIIKVGNHDVDFTCLGKVLETANYVKLHSDMVSPLEDAICDEPMMPFGGIYTIGPHYINGRPVYISEEGYRIYFLIETWVIEYTDEDGNTSLGTLISRFGNNWRPDDFVDWDYVTSNMQYISVSGLRVYCQATFSPTSTPSKTPTTLPTQGPSFSPTPIPTYLPSKQPGRFPSLSPQLSCQNFILSQSACDEFTDLDALFIVDSSNSIAPEEYDGYKGWLAGAIPASIPVDSNLALMQYATRQQIEFQFQEYTTPQQWQAQISEMKHVGGLTWTKTAFQYAFQHIWPNSSPLRQRIMVLITDGVWSEGQNPCDLYIEMTAKGIDLIVVGNQEVRENIDCLEQQNVYFVDLTIARTFDQFDEDAEELLNIRAVFCPDSTPFDGGYTMLNQPFGAFPMYMHTDKHVASHNGTHWQFVNEGVGLMVELEASDSVAPNDRGNWVFTNSTGYVTIYYDVRVFCSDTEIPTYVPTECPSTSMPTVLPTMNPTTDTPSKHPTSSIPTNMPTDCPSTSAPTVQPTMNPTTDTPSKFPTISIPTQIPSDGPSNSPTTDQPSRNPTSSIPTNLPTVPPTQGPSDFPSRTPSIAPTAPTRHPTFSYPSFCPSTDPTTSGPSVFPTYLPSHNPSKAPLTSEPTTSPTTMPTDCPSYAPTRSPTFCEEHVDSLYIEIESLESMNNDLRDQVSALTCANDDVLMMRINELIFPAQSSHNCTAILDSDSSWSDVQRVHGYNSICDIPILATAEQYANEDQYALVLDEIRNITGPVEKRISEVCKLICANCDFTEASNYAVQNMIDNWAECRANVADLEGELARKDECCRVGSTTSYEPLGCTDFNPAIFEMKDDIAVVENECLLINETIYEEREVSDMVVELTRIKSEIIDWETAVQDGGLLCVYVPRLFCDAVSTCRWHDSQDVCVIIDST